MVIMVGEQSCDRIAISKDVRVSLWQLWWEKGAVIGWPLAKTSELAIVVGEWSCDRITIGKDIKVSL